MSVDITLQDGVSGLATGSQEGNALLTGYCSKGVPGQAYYIGASTDIPDLLGAGPLVDRLQDVFSVTDDAVVVAVPVPATNIGSSLETIEITAGGITGETRIPVSMQDVEPAISHRHVKDLTIIHKSKTTGATFQMVEGEHYHFTPEGEIYFDDHIDTVPVRVQYDSVIDGPFDGNIFFEDNVMTISAPDARNIVITARQSGVDVQLIEGVDYEKENAIQFNLLNDTFDKTSIPRYDQAFTVSVDYTYSVYEQGYRAFALPKYVQNINLTPSVLYHLVYDDYNDINILHIDAPMPENLTCTWESETDASFEKSRHAAPDLTIIGIGKKACQLVIKFTAGGGDAPVFSDPGGIVIPGGTGGVIHDETNWSVASYQVSYDGGHTYSAAKKVPYNGRLQLDEIGVSVIVPSTPLVQAGDRYAIEISEPTIAYAEILPSIENALDLNDVEFVAVCGAIPSDAWPVLSQKADDLWQKHRPTFFLFEYRPPAIESIDNWVTVLLAERAQFAHPFLACCPAYGNVSGNTRNLMGLLVGRLLNIPVMRSIGRVRDGGLATVRLPDGYNESHQQVLENAGYITAKTITGLKSPYFGSARTLAEDSSDFRYIEILRVVFKACRLARLRALNSIHDEAGDPLLGSDASGIAYLKSNIESAVGQMKTVTPKEIVDFVITIPNGQDIVNNGLRLGLRLIGVPIIRELEIFASYTYAGSTFDPRLEAVS